MGKDDKQDEKREALRYPFRMSAQGEAIWLPSKLFAVECRIGTSEKTNTGLGCESKSRAGLIRSLAFF
jgi:hypothetical protein